MFTGGQTGILTHGYFFPSSRWRFPGPERIYVNVLDVKGGVLHSGARVCLGLVSWVRMLVSPQ